MSERPLTNMELGAEVTFWGYPLGEAIAIIRRAEAAGLADVSKRLWDDNHADATRSTTTTAERSSPSSDLEVGG